MTDHSDLRRLAEAATKGPWKAVKGARHSNFADYTVIVQGDNCNLMRIRGGVTDDPSIAMANAEYVAAVSPDRLLRLLEEIAALGTRNAELEELLTMAKDRP